MLHPRAAGLLLLLISPLTTHANPFVPKSELWPIWDASDETSTATISHEQWQGILDRNLRTDDPSGINLFNYAGISDEDSQQLDEYITSLTDIDPRDYPRDEQMAYWINLYNAVTVDLVLDFYPVKSIRKIHGGLLGLGPWNEDAVQVAGETLTLNDIEHRILRPIWKDPRIHYAVNCASLGCPNLSATSFTATNKEELLDQAAADYVNHPRGVAFVKGRLRLSSIYDWYGVDFGADETERLAHLQQYATRDLAEALMNYSGRIKYDYEWDLNGQ